MPAGTVKWYDSSKGYGKIEYSGGEIFVHYSQILMDGYRKLDEGQRVVFSVVQAKKGLQATKVMIVKTED